MASDLAHYLAGRIYSGHSTASEATGKRSFLTPP